MTHSITNALNIPAGPDDRGEGNTTLPGLESMTEQQLWQLAARVLGLLRPKVEEGDGNRKTPLLPSLDEVLDLFDSAEDSAQVELNYGEDCS